MIRGYSQFPERPLTVLLTLRDAKSLSNRRYGVRNFSPLSLRKREDESEGFLNHDDRMAGGDVHTDPK